MIEMNTRAANRARKLTVVAHSDMCTQNPEKLPVKNWKLENPNENNKNK